jgi:hypothetical protein
VASLASAQTVLFGPTTYTRTAGPPNQFTATFPLPTGATAPYTLHLVNGHADGTKRISSATVTLNGTSIFGPSDFGQNVAVLDQIVPLHASNQLEETKGSPISKAPVKRAQSIVPSVFSERGPC